MKELNNLVGLRGLTAEDGTELKPTSGRYVNELPGMASELYQHIANTDQTDARGVWDTVLARSKDMFIEGVAAAIEVYTDYSRTLLQTEAPEVYRPVATIAGPALVGVVLSIEAAGHTSVFIKSVSFIATEASEAATLELHDLQALTLMQLKDAAGQAVEASRTIAVSKGLNQVEINAYAETKYKDLSLFACLHNTPLQALKVPEVANPAVTYAGYTTDTLDDLDGTRLDYTAAGLFLEARVECSVEKYIGRNLQRFTPAFQYLLAAEALREKIHSPRANFWSNGNLQLTQENQAYLSSQANKLVKAVVAKAPVSDICGCSREAPDRITHTYAAL